MRPRRPDPEHESTCCFPTNMVESTAGNLDGRLSELTTLSAEAVAAALRRGDITAEQYASGLLRRCEAGANLNAFISIRADQVLEAARERDRERKSGRGLGPLHGIPVPIKDSINTCDHPTTAGTPALRHFQPKKDAPLVRALRNAGAIVLGKTNLHELSYGYTSNNHAFGAVSNPYESQRIPGGSSGGTGAAIAYRMAPLGIAEDTEGSIRVPAALCGVAGFRPSTGRYSTVGCVPITPLFDQVGPLARTVADLLLFDAVLTGGASSVPRPSLKGVRLGIIRPYFYAGLDSEVERVCNESLARLARAGVQFVEGDIPELSFLIAACTRPVQSHDFRPSLMRYLARYAAGISFESLVAQSSPNVRGLIERALAPGTRDYVSDGQYREVVEVHLPRMRRMFREYFEKTGVDAIILPATILPAPPLGEDDMIVEVRGCRMSLDAAISRNIAPASTAGLPGLVLPAGLTRSGLPVALELDGPSNCDRALLTLGLAIESELGTLPAPKTIQAACG